VVEYESFCFLLKNYRENFVCIGSNDSMLGKIKGPEKPDSQTYESKNKKKDLIFEIFKCFFFSSAPPGARTDPVNPGQPAE